MQFKQKRHWRSEVNTNRFDSAVECVTELCLELLTQKEDFVDVEQAAYRMVSDILCKALGQSLERFDETLYKSKTIAGKVKSREKRSVISLCGEVVFYRRRYQERSHSYLPLDEILALTPRSRLSPATTFELCSLALNLSYKKAAEVFERRSGVHISKPSVGEAVVASACALSGKDTSCKKKAIETLMCEADGVWVALQHNKASRLRASQQNENLAKKTEVSLAVDYAGKQKDRWDKTARLNPHYHISLSGKEVLWDKVSSSIEARFETSSIRHTLFATDGEAGYVAGKERLPGHVIHIYDRYHVFKIVRDLTGPDISCEIISLLCARHLKGALLHLSGYRDFFRANKDFKTAKNIQKLMKFLIKWDREILAGLSYSLGTCEGSNAHVIAARCKTLGRAWGRRRLEAICLLLAYTHSGYSLPKVKREAAQSLMTEPAPSQLAVLKKDDSVSSSVSATNTTYYHQAHFSDEWVAQLLHSWNDDVRII
jgi:hypothetical protein